MKKFLLVCLFLVFAVFMLPGIIQPPGEVSAAHATEVRELAHGLELALLQYHKDFGKFPEGEAGEIVSALRGQNATEKTFLDLPPTALNDHGEMLDPWGTPFRITIDEKHKMPRIQSAGPNRHFEDKPGKRSDDYYSWHDVDAPTSPFSF